MLGTLVAADGLLRSTHAGKRVFYARPPYINADLGVGSHVTRFIGLAQVRQLGTTLRGCGLLDASPAWHRCFGPVGMPTTNVAWWVHNHTCMLSRPLFSSPCTVLRRRLLSDPSLLLQRHP